MSQYVYDYYEISIPGDVFDGEDALERLSHLAIDEAKERAKLYCLPAEWSAERISGEVGDFEVKFKVRRKRYRNSKNLKGCLMATEAQITPA